MIATIEGYVARDKSGALFISKQKPERMTDNTWDTWDMDWVALNKDAFPDLGISWEDEPKKCKITIEI